MKAYKDRLAEETKAGNFDKAIAVKARVEQLEKDPEAERLQKPKRTKPKDTVRFQGHSYAFIKEPVTWQVAKQRCEEMGGHLVCVTSLKEQEFVAKLCGPNVAWIGASDEDEEGVWLNVDHTHPVFAGAILDNADKLEHWMSWSGTAFNDFHAGGRNGYVCEWDK